MTKEEMTKNIKKPTAELYTLMLKHFRWGNIGVSEWDRIMKEFNDCINPYSGTDLEFYTREIAAAYLEVIRWGASEGKRVHPVENRVYMEHAIEPMKYVMEDLRPGDTVTIRQGNKEWFYKISESFTPAGI